VKENTGPFLSHIIFFGFAFTSVFSFFTKKIIGVVDFVGCWWSDGIKRGTVLSQQAVLPIKSAFGVHGNSHVFGDGMAILSSFTGLRLFRSCTLGVI